MARMVMYEFSLYNEEKIPDFQPDGIKKYTAWLIIIREQLTFVKLCSILILESKSMNIQTLHPRYITDEAGKKTEVILSMDTFNQLIEDLEDLAAIAERRDESVTSHKDFLTELKVDGLI